MKYILKFIGLSILYPFAFAILLCEALWNWSFIHLKELNEHYVDQYWRMYFKFKRK